MKKILITLIIWIYIFWNICSSFWYYYPSHNIQISIQTKKTAILLEKHVLKLEKEILYYQKKLNLINDDKINNWIYDIKKIKNWLDAIKYDKIDWLKANILIKAIINKLKSINIQLKPYFKKQLLKNIKKINIIKNKINKQIKNFNNKLQQAIIKVAKNIKSKKNITSKNKAVLFHLNNLKKYSINLDLFKDKKFYSIKELKNFLINNIKWISTQINQIKKLL